VAEQNRQATDKHSAPEEEQPIAASEEQSSEETAQDEPSGPSPEEELTASRAEARKNWDLYLRERAELENFRKRMQREKDDLVRFANENLLRELLPVVDNLARAIEHARKDTDNLEGLLEGVNMTLSQCQKILDKFGVSPVTAVGEPFNPAFHEAMGQLESADYPANTVLQEMQKGYTLNDRLLRPALVLVSKTPSEPPPADE
jgi:molecular chaperone GrpE